MLRSRWMQLVALLFVFVFASVSLIQQMALPEVEGFTRQSAAALNLQLFLLPLFLLTIGSMSIAGDVESGWLSLLKTYPITLRQYVFGKYAALLLSFFVMLALSFSVVIGTGAFVGQLGISWVFVVLSFFNRVDLCCNSFTDRCDSEKPITCISIVACSVGFLATVTFLCINGDMALFLPDMYFKSCSLLIYI